MIGTNSFFGTMIKLEIQPQHFVKCTLTVKTSGRYIYGNYRLIMYLHQSRVIKMVMLTSYREKVIHITSSLLHRVNISLTKLNSDLVNPDHRQISQSIQGGGIMLFEKF